MKTSITLKGPKMMNKKLTLSISMLIILIISLGFINPAFSTNNQTETDTKISSAHHIQVYYLHNTFRCFSCNSIGELTKAAVLGGKVENPQTGEESTIAPVFKDLTDQGKLSFSEINVDNTENHHFLADFHTRSKFPVIVEIKDGRIARYKVLKEVWKLLHGPQDKFISYVQENVKEYSKGL